MLIKSSKDSDSSLVSKLERNTSI